MVCCHIGPSYAEVRGKEYNIWKTEDHCDLIYKWPVINLERSEPMKCPIKSSSLGTSHQISLKIHISRFLSNKNTNMHKELQESLMKNSRELVALGELEFRTNKVIKQIYEAKHAYPANRRELTCLKSSYSCFLPLLITVKNVLDRQT